MSLVDRISITKTRIITRNSAGTVKFDTNKNYLKPDSGGVFKVGGTTAGPCPIGIADSSRDLMVNNSENKGFTTLISRTASDFTRSMSSDFVVTYFVPSHSHTSSTIGRTAVGGLNPERYPNRSLTLLGTTSQNVCTLYRRSTPSASWSSVATGTIKHYRQSSDYIYPSYYGVTSHFYEPQIDMVARSVTDKANPYYYKFVVNSNWGSYISSSESGYEESSIYLPSVGRPLISLGLVVTP